MILTVLMQRSIEEQGRDRTLLACFKMSLPVLGNFRPTNGNYDL